MIIKRKRYFLVSPFPINQGEYIKPPIKLYPSISQGLSVLSSPKEVWVYDLLQPIQEFISVPTPEECPVQYETGEVWYNGKAMVKEVGHYIITGLLKKKVIPVYIGGRRNDITLYQWRYDDNSYHKKSILVVLSRKSAPYILCDPKDAARKIGDLTKNYKPGDILTYYKSEGKIDPISHKKEKFIRVGVVEIEKDGKYKTL